MNGDRPINDAPGSVVAVDVGNSRMKAGLFIFGRLARVASLPLHDPADFEKELPLWGACSGSASTWSIASVNPASSAPFVRWLRERGFTSVMELSDPADLPLRVELDRTEAVGIDRLLDAVAVNDRRPPDRPAVIVDAGSAITVDAISRDGAFLGGAIAAGLGLAARGLHEFTFWLPLVSVESPPAAIGKSTPDAMKSGLFWGTVGAIKELVRQVAAPLGGDSIVYLTGGDGERLAPHLGRPVELVSDLTLHGIYLATQHVRRTTRA